MANGNQTWGNKESREEREKNHRPTLENTTGTQVYITHTYAPMGVSIHTHRPARCIQVCSVFETQSNYSALFYNSGKTKTNIDDETSALTRLFLDSFTQATLDSGKRLPNKSLIGKHKLITGGVVFGLAVPAQNDRPRGVVAPVRLVPRPLRVAVDRGHPGEADRGPGDGQVSNRPKPCRGCSPA